MENMHIGVYELILMALIFGGVTWSLIWKGIALWHAARNGQKGWFIALMVINTIGVLEIVYLKFFQEKSRLAPGLGATPVSPS